MRPLCLLVIASLALGVALPVSAATYVMMRDEDLTDRAPIVVEVEILARETGLFAEPVTDYQVQLRGPAIKGFVPGNTLVVRVPGGTTASGTQLLLTGVPDLAVGTQAVLFLVPRDDGAYGIYQLGLGAFWGVQLPGRRLALRNLSESLVLNTAGEPAAPETARDLDRFVSWIRDRASGNERPADYLVDVPQGGLQSLHEAFTLFESDGLNLRWPDFDTNGSVTFFAHQGGQPGLSGGGFTEFQAALETWNDDPSTPINLLYGGTTNANGGLTEFDDIDAIQFDDPHGNPVFGGPFDCGEGGVIAIGGPWFLGDNTHTFNGEEFISILGADVITNENVSCVLDMNNGAEEVFAHELGHTLGLRHSCGDADSGTCNPGSTLDQALMRALAHLDGRGGQLNADDRAGISFLYEPQTGTCIPGPTTLCLNNDRFRVDVDWRTPDNNTGPGMGLELTSDTGYFWFFSPDNVEMVLKVLDACSFNDRFWVFAGGLTNVEVDITVTDTQSGSVKSYMNPLNTQFQPIQDTQAFATCP